MNWRTWGSWRAECVLKMVCFSDPWQWKNTGFSFTWPFRSAQWLPRFESTSLQNIPCTRSWQNQAFLLEKKIVYPNRILHHIGSSAVISLEREIQGKRIIFKLFMLLESTASPIKLGFCSTVTWSFWDITVAPAQTNKGHLLLLLCC